LTGTIYCKVSQANSWNTKVFPIEKVYIDPDCGLKTRTVEEAKAKLKVMVEAVREVRQELGA